MKSIYIFGNWKMNKTFTETLEFLDQFKKEYKKNKKNLREDMTFGIAPATINIPAFQLNEVKELKLCAQNVSCYESNAHTGAVSSEMLKDLNVEYTIVGHSDKKKDNNESHEKTNLKVRELLKYDITPIVCIGENLEEYEKGLTEKVLKNQIEEIFKNVDYSRIILAYEPIWAIGGNNTPAIETIQKTVEYIKTLTSKDIVIIYGGSVSINNINEIFENTCIKGFLVGNASLEVNKFMELLKAKKYEKQQ